MLLLLVHVRRWTTVLRRWLLVLLLLIVLVIVGQKSEMPLRTAVGIMPLAAALEARDLLQRPRWSTILSSTPTHHHPMLATAASSDARSGRCTAFCSAGFRTALGRCTGGRRILLIVMVLIVMIHRPHVTQRPKLRLFLPDAGLALLGRHVLTVRGLVSQLAAVVARRRPLGHLVFGHLRCRRKLESRMHKLALGAVHAQAGQVVGAQHTAHMPVPTMRPVPAKAAIVPRTVANL